MISQLTDALAAAFVFGSFGGQTGFVDAKGTGVLILRATAIRYHRLCRNRRPVRVVRR
jgi:hypothetical protein